MSLVNQSVVNNNNNFILFDGRFPLTITSVMFYFLFIIFLVLAYYIVNNILADKANWVDMGKTADKVEKFMKLLFLYIVKIFIILLLLLLITSLLLKIFSLFTYPIVFSISITFL